MQPRAQQCTCSFKNLHHNKTRIQVPSICTYSCISGHYHFLQKGLAILASNIGKSPKTEIGSPSTRTSLQGNQHSCRCLHSDSIQETKTSSGTFLITAQRRTCYSRIFLSSTVVHESNATGLNESGASSK